MSMFSGKNLHPAIAALIPALAAFILYSPSLGSEFVWDDIQYVRDNEYIREWQYVPAYFTSSEAMMVSGYTHNIYRPLRNISYLVDYTVWKKNPAGYHFQNIFWHALCVYALFFVLRALVGNKTAAFVGAMVFAAHPVLSESVAWVKARDVLMCGAFTMGAFAVFIDWLRRERFHAWRLAIVLLLFTLGVFSYLSAAGLAVVAVVYWLMFRRLLPAGAGRKTALVFGSALVVAAGFLLARHAVLGTTAQCGYIVEGSFAKTMATMMPAAVEYFRLLAFPFVLNSDYSGFPHSVSFGEGRVVMSMVILALLLVLWIVALKRKGFVPAFAGVWIVIFLLPFSNVVPMMQIMAERFLYLSCAGFALLMAWLWNVAQRARDKRTANWPVIFVVVILLFYMFRTGNQIYIWSSELALYRHAHRVDPENMRALGNYGSELFNRGDYRMAIVMLEPYARENPDNYDTLYALGVSYDKTRQPELAMKTMTKLMNLFPDEQDPYICFAVTASSWAPAAVEMGGTPERAAEMREQASAAISTAEEKFGLTPGVMFGKAMVLQHGGDLEGAKHVYVTLLARADCGQHEIHVLVNLARIAVMQENNEEAAEYYRAVLAIDPEHREAQMALGMGMQPFGGTW